MAVPAVTTSSTGREKPQLKSPCWNISRGYLNRKRKSFSTTRAQSTVSRLVPIQLSHFFHDRTRSNGTLNCQADQRHLEDLSLDDREHFTRCDARRGRGDGAQRFPNHRARLERPTPVPTVGVHAGASLAGAETAGA